MSGPELIVLFTLGGAVLLFVTEWLRVDVVAILVLLTLTLTDAVSHDQALSGFANEAVITMAAVLVLSGGLQRTGLANRIGQRVLGVAGRGEAFLTAALMLTVGLLSGIMNDIGVTALMLPVVVSIARRLELPPSKLLMPLAFGSLLGGMTTLIGTAPNILISGVLQDAGHAPFTMFDFTPVGSCVLLAGVAYMVFVGRHLLPTREAPSWEGAAPTRLHGTYDLGRRLFTVTVPPGSVLAAQTLQESRLGAALRLNVMAIIHDGRTLLAPGPDAPLDAGDRLVLEGRTDRLDAIRAWGRLELLPGGARLEQLVSDDVGFAEVVIGEGDLVGRTLFEARVRARSGMNVLAIARGERPRLTRLGAVRLSAGDRLLVLGPRTRFDALRALPGVASMRELNTEDVAAGYALRRRLLRIRVPKASGLVGQSLADSDLRDAFALTVIGIERAAGPVVMPDPDTRIEAGDVLEVAGRVEEFETLAALQALGVDAAPAPEISALQSPEIGIGEIILSPGSQLAGRSVRSLQFRQRYGLTVIAVWRAGRAYRFDLRDMELRFGDAILVYGPRSKLALLAREEDFVVLNEGVQPPYRENKVAIAGLVMLAVLTTAALGLTPIWVAALCGAAAMVVFRCVTPSEAYEHIEWKAIVLVAGMLTLGLAMERSGAAVRIADGVLNTLSPLGPHGVIAGLFLTSVLAAQFMPTAAVAVLMSRIFLSDVPALGVDPHAAMMVVAIASSCAFLSPVGHPVNLLIMGVGGYRFTDYARVGFGLTLVVFAVVMLVLPLFWPL